MRHVPTLLRRELGAYFLSPMAYFILLAFQLMAWLNFNQLVTALSVAQRSLLANPMNYYISGSAPFLIGIMVAVPALTMRLIAEERRTGTIEPLLTAPVTEPEIIIAKWLAGLVMYYTLLLPFALYLPVLYHVGKYYFELGPLFALAIGLSTMGMMFVSIGVLFSAIARNQVVAAIGSFAVLFFIVVLPMLASVAFAGRSAAWADAVQFVSVLYQLNAFGAGQVDIRFLALHLSVTVFMLFLAVKILETRQWK